MIEVTPDNLISVSDVDGPNDDTIETSVGPDNSFESLGNDFLDEPLRTISGVVVEDTDEDGEGEEPIEGVTIQVRTRGASNVLIAETTTGPDGSFSFLVPPGRYRVVEVQPAGFVSVSDLDGGDLDEISNCLLYTSPSPRDQRGSRMPSSA